MSRSFLMVLPIGDAVGRGAGGEHHLDLGDRGGVEAGAEPGEQRQHLRRRVRLHGVEHPRVRQRLGEGPVVVAHDVEVDDEAGPVLGRGCAGNSRMRSVMALSPHRLQRRGGPLDVKVQAANRPASAGEGCGDRAMETRRARRAASPDDAALDWIGETRSARAAMMNKPLRCPSRWWRTGRDQKSPLRRCFKPRPPWRTGCAGFASGCRSSVRSSNDPNLR